MSKMEGSETGSLINNKICVICGVNIGKYKFKCCLRKFCSLECFQIHSREECSLKSKHISDAFQSDQKFEEICNEMKFESAIEETEQFDLTEKEKEALNSNERLSSLLRNNPRLVEMIKFIENSENKTEALALIMDEDSKDKDKLFVEFTELVAESLGEEFKTYKNTYDFIVSDIALRR
ncbi:unnamed protein product [Cryptosporidium hominis]|uniref:HIT-type domain-containing protein n=1 Tax=Cryptosporidium hominis TaxID=237895 RepID=A0A0S4TKI9_CRYHO|nr:hypothetical protein ChTU502y2012_421g0470 [Cryptosporidium hominis]PPA64710.1 hypothetical protein ChUKH1_01505 [Cryptosporidium hominis]CUV07818.1 unnamed protein product [Cryptosporidium hominis]